MSWRKFLAMAGKRSWERSCHRVGVRHGWSGQSHRRPRRALFPASSTERTPFTISFLGQSDLIQAMRSQSRSGSTSLRDHVAASASFLLPRRQKIEQVLERRNAFRQHVHHPPRMAQDVELVEKRGVCSLGVIPPIPFAIAENRCIGRDHERLAIRRQGARHELLRESPRAEDIDLHPMPQAGNFGDVLDKSIGDGALNEGNSLRGRSARKTQIAIAGEQSAKSSRSDHRWAETSGCPKIDVDGSTEPDFTSVRGMNSS